MDVQDLITETVEQVKRVEGVSAIVLGGSRARGTHTPESDIDLCIYLFSAAPRIGFSDRSRVEFDV
jgi:predicted nucleotidyltransferase